MTAVQLPNRLHICTLLLAVCALALLGLMSGNRQQNWLDDLLLTSRADANVQAAAVRKPFAMPVELAVVVARPAGELTANPEEARLINAALPFSRAAIEAARPFQIPSQASDRERALHCLTQAIYYEAGFEPLAGRRAVAQVVLNRMRHPAFPHSVCGVIYQGASAPGCQFSFACDGALARIPVRWAWEEAAAIAREALNGRVYAGVGQATHYHASYVAPYWAPRLAKITQIGAHIFYRWPGGWGLRRVFTNGYAGEPALNSVMIAGTTLDAAEGVDALPSDPRDRRAENDIGGRLDVTKGWTLSIPGPEETKASYARVMAGQVNQPATAVVAMAETGAVSKGR